MSEAFLFQGVAHEVHDPDMYIHPLIFNGWFKGTSRMSRTSLTYLLREVFMCDLTSLPPTLARREVCTTPPSLSHHVSTVDPN